MNCRICGQPMKKTSAVVVSNRRPVVVLSCANDKCPNCAPLESGFVVVSDEMTYGLAQMQIDELRRRLHRE